MTKVFFAPSQEFAEKVKKLFGRIRSELLDKFPNADIQDMGSTSVPGLLTKGDLDINMRVDKEDFAAAVEYLKTKYHPHQLGNWSDGFASFSDGEGNNELPLGIQVTVKGHEEDKFLRQRDLLASRPDLIAKYNKLKQEYNGREMDEYRQAKWRFIEDNLTDA